MLQRIKGHLDGGQCKHTLKTVTVPSVRLLHRDGAVNVQQDHSSIHDSNSSRMAVATG